MSERRSPVDQCPLLTAHLFPLWPRAATAFRANSPSSPSLRQRIASHCIRRRRSCKRRPYPPSPPPKCPPPYTPPSAPVLLPHSLLIFPSNHICLSYSRLVLFFSSSNKPHPHPRPHSLSHSLLHSRVHPFLLLAAVPCCLRMCDPSSSPACFLLFAA